MDRLKATRRLWNFQPFVNYNISLWVLPHLCLIQTFKIKPVTLLQQNSQMENQGLNDDNATISDVSVEANPSTSSNCPRPNPESQSNNDLGDGNSTEALAKALSSMLTSLIKDYDSKAHDTLASQDLLSSSIDRLTRELDQLLEDAPLPFIMQHAAKFSNVRKRVLSLNLLLKSIQRRVDNIDRMLSVGLQHEKTATEDS